MLVGNIVIALLTALVPYLVVSVEFTALVRRFGYDITNSEACSSAWFWTSGFAFFAFITNLVREIIKDMEDIKGDRMGGCHTLPIEMGIVNSKVVVNVLLGFMLTVIWGIYFYIPEIKLIPLAFPYLVGLLTIPIVFLMVKVHTARRTTEFHSAGRLSKLVMLFGILFIVLVGLLY